MKIYRNILTVLSVLCLLLTMGCSNEQIEYNNTDYIDYSFDMQIMYHQGGAYTPMTKSDTGYYYVGDDGIVIYIDKESKKATPLCSKPNCLHDDKDNCDAYFDISEYFVIDPLFGCFGTAIQCYDEHLYMVCGEYDQSNIEYKTYLLKMDLDGKNQERLNEYFDCAFSDWFIHRGYLYYSTDSALLRLPIDDINGEPQVLHETEYYTEDATNTYHGLSAYGNYLYFTLSEKDEDGMAKGEVKMILNLDTLEVSEMPVIDGNQTVTAWFVDSKLVMQYSDAKRDVRKYYISELDGSNYEEMFEEEQKTAKRMISDGKYIYTDNRVLVAKGIDKEQIIEVYDLDLNFVDSFKLPESEMKVVNSFNAHDNEYFLLESLDSNNERILVMADKSQIGSIGGEVIEYTPVCKLDWHKNQSSAYVSAE